MTQGGQQIAHTPELRKRLGRVYALLLQRDRRAAQETAAQGSARKKAAGGQRAVAGEAQDERGH